VLVRNHHRATQRAWPLIAAMAVVALLLAVSAAPMSAAAPAKIELSGISVTPRTGTPKTTIVVSVVYRSLRGTHADQVTAAIDGKD